MIRWSQAEVAKAANLSVPTVQRAESPREFPASEASVAAMREALEAAGVRFLSSPTTIGVELRPR